MNIVIEKAKYNIKTLLNYLNELNIECLSRDRLLLAALCQAVYDREESHVLVVLMEVGANPNKMCENKYPIDLTQSIEIKNLIY